ncbi:MAG: type II secretion system F family protein [Phycisphaeraceae bacterium]|nr:type II secretion system F family protein [Phycisphaeraceae bacterium]
MPTFTYEARDAQGKMRKGTLEAATDEEAIGRLKNQSLYPTAVREQKVKKSGVAEGPAVKKKRGGGIVLFGKVKRKHLTQFTRQLSTLQDAGLPLLRSLQILEGQAKPGPLKNVLIDLTDQVQGGSSLSEAMAKHPKAFDRLYVKMIAAGEVGGVLDIILQRLAEFMEKAQRLKRQIRGALVYPLVVVFVAICILVLIMVVIIPQFQKIFEDFGVELPKLTIWLTNTSTWMAGQQPGQVVPGAVIFVGIVVAIPFVWKLVRLAKPGRALTDRMVLWTPVIGNVSSKSTVAKFTRTLGTLVSAGVPILEAIRITADTSGNAVFEKALMRVHDAVREGESFAVPLRESKTCEPIVVNMVDVGEETGELDVMLMKIADNYDEEVDVAVKSALSLLEPVMVVAIGGMVGTIVIAMFLPMVAMIESLNGGGF